MSIDRKAAVVCAIRHQETQFLPYTFSWDDEDVARRLDDYYSGPEWRKQFSSYIIPVAAADDHRRVGEPGPALRRDLYGSVWRTDLRPVHLEEPVLKEPTLRGYRFPDPDQFFEHDVLGVARRIAEENRDAFVVARMGFGVFERCWDLRGFDNLLMDIAAEPNFFADLVAAVTDFYLQLLDRILELPVDGMMFGDDWGDQRGVIMHPETWRQVIKPNQARLFARAKAAGKYTLHHCCGSVVDIIPDLVEIQLDVLESVQPEARGMNPYELKDHFGDRITFWGGLGSQSIVPFGKPDELRSEIHRLAAHMRKGGGDNLAPAKALQPETPAANAAAMLEEFTALGEPTPFRSDPPKSARGS